MTRTTLFRRSPDHALVAPALCAVGFIASISIARDAHAQTNPAGETASTALAPSTPAASPVVIGPAENVPTTVAPVASAPAPTTIVYAAAPVAPVATRVDGRTGVVTGRHDRFVIISGTAWQRGEPIEFLRLRPSDDESGHDTEVMAIGEVASVAPDHARVRVGLDTRIPYGTTARPSARPFNPYPLAPPRLANVLEAGADVRAFLPINVPVGVGVLGGLHAAYHFAVPIALRANVSALGAVTSDPGGATAVGHGLITLDTQYFEVGLGAGGMTIPASYSNPTMSGSFSLAQFVRIGSIDGVMAQVQTDVYVQSQRFALGNVSAMLQVPVNDSWWLQARGGGGVGGFLDVEAAVRHRMWGNGDSGTFFLTGSVGGAAIATANGAYGGPSVGVGLDWRI